MHDHDGARSRGWFTATMAFVVAFWLVDLFVLRGGSADPLDDSWEYLAVARSLLEGHGFRTPVIHPPLWTLRDAELTVPVLVHGPLLPLLLAPLLAIAGTALAGALSVLSALFAIAAAAIAQRLGARTMGDAVGTAGAILFTLSPLVIRAVHHDIALTLGAFLLVLSLDQLLRTRPHGTRAGLALGLGLLARPEFLLAAPILAYFAGGARRRFLLVAAACAAPWWWHGVVHAGSPFFNLSSYLLIGYWRERPGISVMRDFSLPPHLWSAELLASFTSLPAKWIEFFPHALKRMLSAPSETTGWLAPIGALAATQGPRSRPLAVAVAALALIPLATMTLTLYDPRYLTPFLAIGALAAARGGCELAEFLPSWGRRPRTWMTLLAMLSVAPAGTALHDAWSEGRILRERLAQERAALAALFAREGGSPRMVFTDTPDFVAWTTGRAAVWVSREEYERLPLAGNADPPDRPVRSADDVVWFHAAEGRGPVLAEPAPTVAADSSAAGAAAATGR